MPTALPSLQLSVQYAAPAPDLTRPRLRRWVQATLRQLARDTTDLPTGLALTLRLVERDEGQNLNREYRQKDYATNVLTFPYGETPDGVCHADVVLCLPVLHAEALAQGKPLLAHAAHLVVHGTLHALGYDHEEPEQATAMEQLETRILARLHVPDPYATHDDD